MTGSRKETAGPFEAESPPRRRNRRQAIALGGAAAAAAAVAVLGMERGRKAHAATGDPLIIGQANETDPGNATSLSGNVVGNKPGSGAVLDISNLSPDRGHGLRVDARGGFGPEGPSVAIWGHALSADGTGSGAGHGVMGWTGTGIGVHGVANEEGGVGVKGSAPGSAPGVQAFSGTIPPSPDGGLALDVMGKAAFSTAGAGVVPGGVGGAIVLDPAVTAESHITVTFTGYPGPARVAWVQRFAGAGFILRLAGKPPADAPFTYLIVEPGG